MEKNYSATELEALAILSAVNHFVHFLWGRPFTIVTDHRALVSFQSSKVLNRRLHGWRLKLADFNFSIVYRPGKLNGGADGLSRQAQTVEEDVMEPRAAPSSVRGDVGPQRLPLKE